MTLETKSLCSHRDGYSVVTFPKDICKAHLAEIRETGEQVIAELANVRAPQCVVDLTGLDYISSSVVAAIVRIWKTIDSSQGRMVLAAPSSGVREVLRVTGLNQVWSIESSYDSALHELGFSVQAQNSKRELRLLAFVGPATLLLGGIATAFSRIPRLAAFSSPQDLIALSLMGLSVATAGISVFREHSWRRWLSVIVFLAATPMLGWLIWLKVSVDSKPPSAGDRRAVVQDEQPTDADATESSSIGEDAPPAESDNNAP